jgi:hypothetical protein
MWGNMTNKNARAGKAPQTRKVRVNEQRSYVDEEIIDIEAEQIAIEEEQPPDPIVEFLRSLDTERVLTLHAFVHPKYEIDGRVGTHAERVYVTSFNFTADETETYRSRIQYCYPQGGMFQFELRERGVVLKKWHEKLSAAPGHEAPPKNPFPFPSPPVINIRTPDQKVEPAVSPIQVLKDQFATMKEMVGIVKDLMPPAPVVNVGETTNGQSNGDQPLGDRLLETVLIKALESGKTPADKIFEYLANGKREKPGFMDSLGPVLAEIAKGLTPVLSMGIQQYMRSAGAAQAQAQGQPAPAVSEPAQLEAGSAVPVMPSLDPSERAWRRVVQRMLEDCFEHVQIRAASAVDGINVATAASAIVDLLDRFPEQLTQVVEMLLQSPAEEVIEMCATLQPNPQLAEAVKTLAQQPAALNWIVELQTETKKIIAEGGEGDE